MSDRQPQRALPLTVETPRLFVERDGSLICFTWPLTVARSDLPAPDLWDRLTPRQRDVLWELACDGATDAQIAARLGISVYRVHHCLYLARVTLGLWGRSDTGGTRAIMALWVWSLFGDPMEFPPRGAR